LPYFLGFLYVFLKIVTQALVAQACNPSYSGGRDQEDCGSKPAWANSSVRPFFEKPFTKIGLVDWLKVKALSSSPSTKKRNLVVRCSDTHL
jgi:hypothetical protein